MILYYVPIDPNRRWVHLELKLGYMLCNVHCAHNYSIMMMTTLLTRLICI